VDVGNTWNVRKQHCTQRETPYFLGLAGSVSLFLELQSPDIPRTVHHAHDDDFGIRKPIVQRVVAMKVHAQALDQVVPAGTDLGMELDR